MNRYFRLITDSGYRFVVLGNIGFYKKMPDDKYLSRRFNYLTGMELHLDNPRSFNEKLQWLKIHDRNPLYIKLVDKGEVKQWVTQRIGSEYVIPTYGIYDSFDRIDFDSLPDQFVIKCTHDSGSSIICRDKSNFDIGAAKKKLEKCLKKNLFWPSREWAYKDVKPRIIVEKYITDFSNADLIDYKIMCFNGKAKCSFTCTERAKGKDMKVTFFDADWNVMPFERHYHKSDVNIPKPINYEKMIFLAEILSKDITFARIDFYDVNGKIYFGEVTLYPGAGTEEFRPEEWDYKLGDMLELPSSN